LLVDPHEIPDTRRIVILRGKNPEVLLCSDGNHHVLPELEVPRRQRIVGHLTAGLSTTYGVNGIWLSSFEAPSMESGPRKTRYEVMEHCGSNDEPPGNKIWVELGRLVEGGFRDPCDFRALHRAIADIRRDTDGPLSGPFTRLGWFYEFKRWVEEKIRPHGLHLTGKFRQFNASPQFNLLRFETDGPAVWFKAAGPPNQREFPLTLALAHLFPRFVPKLIAVHHQWNGWLAQEALGHTLHESSEMASWETAARDLANLQICSLGRGLHILEAGAYDLRSAVLASRVEPFFQTMGQLMDTQTKTTPAALSADELHSLSVQVRDAIAILGEVPTTLGHLDINPGNIVCSPTGSVFLDWAEAFVGHPFMTFQYLLEHFRRAFGEHDPRETQLVARYCSPWRNFISEDAIRRALEIAPLIAVFSFATGNDLWTDSQKLQEPDVAAYLRSLARRMNREIHALSQLGVPCRS
jgi:hypothetical protein